MKIISVGPVLENTLPISKISLAEKYLQHCSNSNLSRRSHHGITKCSLTHKRNTAKVSNFKFNIKLNSTVYLFRFIFEYSFYVSTEKVTSEFLKYQMKLMDLR